MLNKLLSSAKVVKTETKVLLSMKNIVINLFQPKIYTKADNLCIII